MTVTRRSSSIPPSKSLWRGFSLFVEGIEVLMRWLYRVTSVSRL
jgi:hypothetical protein